MWNWQQLQDVPPLDGLTGSDRSLVGWAVQSVSLSGDDGLTWTRIPAQLPPLSSVVVDPFDAAHVLAGTNGFSSLDAGILESIDGGRTFSQRSGTRVAPLTFGRFRRNVVYGFSAPAARMFAHAGTTTWTQIFLISADGGSTWRLSASGQTRPVTQVVVDPRTPGNLHVAGGTGIWSSNDSGEHWSR